MTNNDIIDLAKKFAAHNAFLHEGTAQSGSVIGKVLAEYPELKPRIKEIIPLINQGIAEVNSWTHEKQQKYILENYPYLFETKKVEEKPKTLPPLKNIEKWSNIKTRFAPNPDGALHLGSAEPIIFCDEYAKMYNGKFILRFEDTSAEIKPPIPEMYDAILVDIDWLGVNVDEIYIQSDRIEIYYKYAEKLLSDGNAYVCDCEVDKFRKLYMEKEACPCRVLSPDEQIRRWNMMLNGVYKKGEAVVRMKTDLQDPNPAVRDWPALRISEAWHPRQGNKYRVWPLYNFSCGLDDHLMGVSHIIRGKEHDVNTTRQRWLQKHLEWKYPEIINVGRLGLEAGILSKSKIRAGIEEGTYSGWDDPRLGTLQALRKRGIQPKTIRNTMIHVGPKPVNVLISWDNFAAENRKLIEHRCNRYSFIQNPVKLTINNVNNTIIAKLPVHPDFPERGSRDFILEPENKEIPLYISERDIEKFYDGTLIRLMGIANIKTLKVGEVIKTEYHSEDYKIAREEGVPFINWLPYGEGVKAKVILPDASEAIGLAEKRVHNLKPDELFQFERFGYCRVENRKPFVAFFTHK